jgi:hypothetical protein
LTSKCTIWSLLLSFFPESLDMWCGKTPASLTPGLVHAGQVLCHWAACQPHSNVWRHHPGGGITHCWPAGRVNFLCVYWIFLILLWFFFITGGWARGLALARQVLYCLSRVKFAVQVRSPTFVPAALDLNSSTFASRVAGITDPNLHILVISEIGSQELCLGWSQTKILPLLPSECLGLQEYTTIPGFFVFWDGLTVKPRLAWDVWSPALGSQVLGL